ncbi:MAG: hypothetical protein M1818_005373 [Claussenomyces sp. TS43310]|nr:MAG: hypothetical protein M1818_005373 [Claussenomyces sp. TS43310]
MNSTSTTATPPSTSSTVAASSSPLFSSSTTAVATSSANTFPSSPTVPSSSTSAATSSLITTPFEQSSTSAPSSSSYSYSSSESQSSASSTTSAFATEPSSTPQATSTPTESTTPAPQGTTSLTTIVITPTSSNVPQPPVTIIQTSTAGEASPSGTSSSASSTSTQGASLTQSGSSNKSSGLSGGGKTAVEVVVPIVAVALLVLAGLFFWRKRKQRKDAEDLRRKEVEEYGYNPNDDPSLPPTGAGTVNTGSDGPFEMREDGQGYRGWGATTLAGSSTGRKASTTLSGGLGGNAQSEGTSPTHGPVSDTRSGDPLVGSPNARPLSEGSEALGAMGPAAASNRSAEVHRGPSNASSSYSAANRSDGSGEGVLPSGSYGAAQYYSGDAAYGGPYSETQYGSPPGRAEMPGQPVIRENLARRATRIENPSHFPTQASAGISQNF